MFTVFDLHYAIDFFKLYLRDGANFIFWVNNSAKRNQCCCNLNCVIT